ncbi:RAD55 family ATPase [Natrononativus amylolyticus]|uniref:RAD55 family ATPase n=1 Tax=Natrononativus amylolyticus TaxID=2963434 RepID=UPI0020CE2943|nr:recombinase RecA [Natrononativus amylolyticus]
MYELPPILEEAEVKPGTNVLVAGPPLAGKRELALDVLASGAERGDGSIVVTTKDDASSILRTFGETVEHLEGEVPRVGVVDCVTKQRGGTLEDDLRVKYAASPVDMTGIGISVSEFLQEFYEVHGRTKNRILLSSISTLLMYADLQAVFRFLHVFTGRVQSANGLGVYVIDSTSHDDRTMNTLTQLFDAIVEVEAGSETKPTIRTAGRSP